MNSFRHIYLQKVVTFLLFNPKLVHQVLKNRHMKILGEILTEEEQKWILDIDPRRWSIDLERPHRSLEGALFHCPVTGLALSSFLYEVRHTNKKYSNPLLYLLKFYQSSHFSDCIQNDHYLVDSLIAWIFNDLTLKKFPKTQRKSLTILKSIIRVEQEVIKIKRRVINNNISTELSEHSILKLGEKYCLLPSQHGVAEVYLALNQKAISITQTRQRADLLLGRIKLTSLPIDIKQTQLILIEKQGVNVSVESLSDGLAEVLKLAQNGISFTQLIDYLCTEEMTEDEARELINSWKKDGLILSKS